MKHSLTVLIVDDSASDVRLVREALAGTPVPPHLIVVADGQEALAFLRRDDPYAAAPRPDLVLTDLNLPRLSGHALVGIMKSDPALPRLPVVMFSTSADPADIATAYDLHVNAYVTKPADLDAFFAAVQAILRFWSATAALPPPP